MDVLYFLKHRTPFIRRFYDAAEETFAETKCKIRDSEPPFDEYPPGCNPEDGEPPFLEEYMDAPSEASSIMAQAISRV
jgi:hypothetical protein